MVSGHASGTRLKGRMRVNHKEEEIKGIPGSGQ